MPPIQKYDFVEQDVGETMLKTFAAIAAENNRRRELQQRQTQSLANEYFKDRGLTIREAGASIINRKNEAAASKAEAEALELDVAASDEAAFQAALLEKQKSNKRGLTLRTRMNSRHAAEREAAFAEYAKLRDLFSVSHSKEIANELKSLEDTAAFREKQEAAAEKERARQAEAARRAGQADTRIAQGDRKQDFAEGKEETRKGEFQQRMSATDKRAADRAKQKEAHDARVAAWNIHKEKVANLKAQASQMFQAYENSRKEEKTDQAEVQWREYQRILGDIKAEEGKAPTLIPNMPASDGAATPPPGAAAPLERFIRRNPKPNPLTIPQTEGGLINPAAAPAVPENVKPLGAIYDAIPSLASLYPNVFGGGGAQGFALPPVNAGV